MQPQRHQPDFILIITVLLLTAIGIITVYSASTVITLHFDKAASSYAIKQLIFAVIGCLLMVGIMRVPYRALYRFAPILLAINSVFLILVLIPGIGIKIEGARRWIGASSLQLQPSEMAILTTLLYLAFFFTKKVTLVHSFRKGVQPALLIVGMNFGLIILEPDMGTALTLLAASAVIIFTSGSRLKPLLLTLAGVIPLLYILAHAASYRSNRMVAFLHPFKNADKAYQLLQGLTGIAAGGWFGRGFDMSVEKTGYLPIPQADFIFAVFTEEWGLVGAITLLVIFAVIIWRGFRIARHARDRFGALLATGLTGMIIIPSFINLGAVTWLLPVTGIPLPFISYGGSALIVNLAAMGMLLSISRETVEEAPEVDELADVFYVDDIREEQRSAVAAQTAPASRNTGMFQSSTVQPLRKKIEKKPVRNLGKNQNNELSPTPSSMGTSWRERNQATHRPANRKDKIKHNTKSQKQKD